MRRLFLTTALAPIFALTGGTASGSIMSLSPPPVSQGRGHSAPRSKTTCAQMKRQAAKRKAQRRARRLGHA